MPKRINKQLERARERELIKLYKTTKSPEALEELLKSHTAYIQKIASQQYIKFGKVVEYEDLVQEGRIGLIKAINKFDMNRQSINPNDNSVVTNQALLTYAHLSIISEMQNLYHRSHPAHIPAHTLRAISFNVTNPGSNTEERKTKAKLAMRADSLDAYNDFYDSDSSHDGYNFALSGDSKDPTFEESDKNMLAPIVQQAVKKLSDIEQKVFFMRYGIEEGASAKPNHIANELNLDKEDVDKILKRAKRLLIKNKNLKEYFSLVK
jgi:RNA polymerase sigma factor (sigma-70 family)